MPHRGNTPFVRILVAPPDAHLETHEPGHQGRARAGWGRGGTRARPVGSGRASRWKGTTRSVEGLRQRTSAGCRCSSKGAVRLGPRSCEASIGDSCTYTLVRGACRAPRTLHPRAAPPELLGGVAEGPRAALVAAGGGRTPSSGCRWRRSPCGRGATDRHSTVVDPGCVTSRPRLGLRGALFGVEPSDPHRGIPSALGPQ